MKTLLLIIATMFVASAANAQEAQVIKTEPLYETRYERVCRDEYVTVQREYAPRNSGNEIVGAIIGGVVGNQFGGGDGKTAMTAIGAVIGSNVARNNGNKHIHEETQIQTVCSNNPVREQRGEIVTFRYNGRTFTQTFRY